MGRVFFNTRNNLDTTSITGTTTYVMTEEDSGKTFMVSGGTALLNASQNLTADTEGEKILFKAITAPFHTVLENAGLEQTEPRPKKGLGVNVVTGKEANMIEAGIIDPVLVTKSALKNAVSVVSTIISADCVISNMRMNESDQ